MNGPGAAAFVRRQLVPERAAPVKTSGFAGLVRTRLFNSPTNVILTPGGRLAFVPFTHPKSDAILITTKDFQAVIGRAAIQHEILNVLVPLVEH